MSHFSWGCWTFWTSLKHGIWWRKSIPNVWVMWKNRTCNPTPDMTDRIEPEEMDAPSTTHLLQAHSMRETSPQGYCLPSGSDCYIAIETGDLVRGFTNWTWWCSIVFCKRLPALADQSPYITCLFGCTIGLSCFFWNNQFQELLGIASSTGTYMPDFRDLRKNRICMYVYIYMIMHIQTI